MSDALERHALEYVAAKNLPELWADLGAALAHHMPDDVTGFLIKELDRRRAEGSECGMV